MGKYNDPVVIRLMSIFELLSPEEKQERCPIQALHENDNENSPKQKCQRMVTGDNWRKLSETCMINYNIWV